MLHRVLVVWGCLGSTLLIQGKLKPNLLLKVAGTGRDQVHACRNLTRLIKRTPGATLPIPIDVCKVNIRQRKPLRHAEVYWPMLKISEWCKYLLQYKPQLILGGHETTGNWRPMFRQFWQHYKQVNPTHPLFSQSSWDYGACLPFMIHGDEGRGQLKRPFLVLSIQFAVGHGGLESTNDSSNLVCKSYD